MTTDCLRAGSGHPPDLFLVWDYPSLASRGGLEPLDKCDINFSQDQPCTGRMELLQWPHLWYSQGLDHAVIWYIQEGLRPLQSNLSTDWMDMGRLQEYGEDPDT